MALSTFRCKFWCFVVSGILDLDLATSALVHYELLSCADFSTVSSSSQTFEDMEMKNAFESLLEMSTFGRRFSVAVFAH